MRSLADSIGRALKLAYIKVAIDGLNIAIVSPKPSSKSAKGKGKAAKSLDILTNAELRLKAGVHCLLGRNVTGKSSK